MSLQPGGASLRRADTAPSPPQVTTPSARAASRSSVSASLEDTSKAYSQGASRGSRWVSSFRAARVSPRSPWGSLMRLRFPVSSPSRALNRGSPGWLPGVMWRSTPRGWTRVRPKGRSTQVPGRRSPSSSWSRSSRTSRRSIPRTSRSSSSAPGGAYWASRGSSSPESRARPRLSTASSTTSTSRGGPDRVSFSRSSSVSSRAGSSSWGSSVPAAKITRIPPLSPAAPPHRRRRSGFPACPPGPEWSGRGS